MRLIALLLVLGLAACTIAPTSTANLADAVSRVTKQTASDYKHVFVDLNADGAKDAIVLLRGSQWCGSGGCTMLVFEARGAGYDFISRSTVTNKPIRIAEARSHAWKTIIVHSDGAARLMRFDGAAYPLNPSMQPAAGQQQINSSITVLPHTEHADAL